MFLSFPQPPIDMRCCREKRPSPVFYLAGDDETEPPTDAPDDGCRADDRETAKSRAPANGGGQLRMRYSGKSYYELDKLGAHRGADYESRRRYLRTAAPQTGIADAAACRSEGDVPQETDAGPVAPQQQLQQGAEVTSDAFKGAAAADDGTIAMDVTDDDKDDEVEPAGCLLTAVACGMHTCGCVVS